MEGKVKVLDWKITVSFLFSMTMSAFGVLPKPNLIILKICLIWVVERSIFWKECNQDAIWVWVSVCILTDLVQFSHSVVSDSLRTHGSQHARPACPSPAPGVYPNSCPLTRWCHPTISPVVPFSSCPQTFPASGSFPMSQLFAWGGQSIGVSASTILPMNTQVLWARETLTLAAIV